jgi:hypothetical protein
VHPLACNVITVRPKPKRLTILGVESYGCNCRSTAGPSKSGLKPAGFPRASRAIALHHSERLSAALPVHRDGEPVEPPADCLVDAGGRPAAGAGRDGEVGAQYGLRLRFGDEGTDIPGFAGGIGGALGVDEPPSPPENNPSRSRVALLASGRSGCQ